MTAALDEALALARDLRMEKAKRGLLNFTAYTKSDFEVNWHHRAIAIVTNMLFRGGTPRQALRALGHSEDDIEYMAENPHPVTKLYAGCTRPEALDHPMTAVQFHVHPRSGKTELIGRRTPAWQLGEQPTGRIIATAYGADLAAMANRDVQRIIDNDCYRSLYPTTRLNDSNVRSVATGSWLRNSDLFEIVGHGGSYKSSGVGGGITGLGASLAAIVDDPFKNRKQAESPVERHGVISWYNSTLYTRLEQHARQIIINTRWHEADLSGATLKVGRDDPMATQWFCLVFPAILDCEPGPGDFRKQGEPLWASRYSLKRLQTIKATIGPYEWDALYQQRPSPGKGGVINSDWWQFYDVRPTELDRIVISADLTFSNRGDYAVFQVWGQRGVNRFLLEERRDRMTFTEQLATAVALHKRFPNLHAFVVENAANGAALINVLKNKIPCMVPIHPDSSKKMRVDSVAPQVQAGNVHLPAASIAPWIHEWVEEFKNFPNAAHDDRVDAMSQALTYMRAHDDDMGDLLFPSLEQESQWLD